LESSARGIDDIDKHQQRMLLLPAFSSSAGFDVGWVLDMHGRVVC
jgi:hypothetical protein